MRKTMKKLTQGATRLLVLALGLGLVSTGWAVAPTPTVVWDGDFSTTVSKTGTDGNSYVFSSLNGLSVNGDGNLVINTANAQGALIALPDTSKTAATVVIKYSNLAAETTGNATLANFQVFSGDTQYYIGSRSIGAGTLNLSAYCESSWYYFDNGTYGHGSVPQVPAGSGYYVFAYDSSVGTYTYTGTALDSLSGGYNTQLKWGSYKIGQVYIGGGQNNSKAYCWKGSGTVIEKVAIFMGVAYTADDLAEYAFPTAGKYANWEYAKDVFTWTSASTADMSSSSATYYLFDRSSGTDTATEYNGGSTAYTGGGNFWKYWTMRQPNYYSAPGFVLRLISGKQSTIGGSFAPLTLGGMIVEEGATGYNFYHGQGSDAESVYGDGKSHRTTIFGDCTGETETWFKFEESISFNRPGRNRLSGTVNFYIASGKTVSINTDTTAAGYSADFDPAIYQTVNETGKNAATLSAGGTLKMHGEGTIAVNTLTATNSVLDYSDLGNRVNTNPFVRGTLVINEGTKFILPEEATSPYKVATAISGTYPTSITIGDKTYAAAVSAGENAGEIAWEINEYTIDMAGDDYVLSTIFPDPASTKDYSLKVEQDATLNVGSSTVRAITIDVAEGKTLTLSGTSLTATTIYVTGKGTVKVTTAGTLQGTLKGDGAVMYSGVLPASSGITLNDSAWRGTVWIYNYGSINSSGIVGDNLSTGNANSQEMANWGNENSYVKFTLVKAYAPNANVTCPYTLVLEDGEGAADYAWRCDNGYSTQTLTFKGIEGNGTFYDGGGVTSLFQFNAFSNFTGKFTITGAGHKIGFPGTQEITSGDWSQANLAISSGDTLSINADLTVKFSNIAGTLNISAGKIVTLSGANDALNYGGSGTVNVYGTLNMDSTRWTIGSSNVINLYAGGTISGVGQSTNGALDWYQPGTLNVYGTSTISANIRCRNTGNLSFNVDSGVCTFSGESYGSMPITKTGSGTLKIAYAGSSSYNLPSVSEGTIEFASGTWNFGAVRSLAGYALSDGGTATIKVEQTQSEYGNGETVVSDVDESVGSITIVRPDGTSTTVTPSSGSATLSEAAVVSGAACWHAYEMNKSIGEGQYQTRIADSGTGNVPLQLYYSDFADSNFTQEGDSDNWYLKYNEKQPYPTSGYNLGTEWTAAIRCTVPTANNGIVVAFGTQSGGLIGLAAGETAGEVIIVRTTGNSQYTKLATMTVAHPTEAQHVYVFTKTADAVTVYCDGDFINRTTVSFTSPSNFQIGSVHGTMGNTGLVGANSGEMDYLRIYNFAITPKMIAKLASDNPYVSPSGTYTRTVTGDDDWVDDDAWTVNYTASTTDAPASDAVAMLTVNGASTMTINLSSAALYEELIFDGSAAVRLEPSEGTAKLSAVKLNVETDVTVAYGAADFSTTRVSVADGKTLTFDFSAEPINSQTERKVVVLTGVTAEPEDLSDSSTWPVQVTTHADAASLSAGFISRFEYDTSSSRYVYTYGPNHTVGGEVYYTGGYWSSDAGNTISVTNSYGEATIIFSGDTVVIPSYYPNDTTWSDNTLPANVTKIRVSKSKIKVCSGANSGDIFTGVTWAVDNGCVLWFGVDTKTTSLGAMTINGPGSVECGNITINGAISGNAPVTILDNVTTRLTATGSIASTHTISGNASALISCAAVPSAMTFASGWAGTVELPSFAATGQQLNDYGVSGSKIKINGVTGGYLYWTDQNIQPEIVLAGNFTINDMSQRNYTFSKFSGTGNISFSPGTYELTGLTITELAVGYSGTVANNMANTTLNIGTLALSSGTSVVGGSRILQTGGTGTIRINAVTVGGEAQTLDLCYESDGVYVAAAEYNSVKYPSVAAAIGVATDANLADITLLNGCTTVPAGYVISENTVVKAMGAVVDTDGVAHYYVTVQAAVDDIASYYESPQYSYFAVYGGENVPVSLNMATWQGVTFKVKCFNDSSVVVTPSSAEFAYTAGEPDENGIVTYTKSESATTYVWVGIGTSAIAWGNNNRWRVGTSEGAVASRAPGVNDTVVINGGAPINLNAPIAVSVLQVGGAATLRNNTDTTFTANSIELTDDAATLTVSSVTLSRTPTTTVADSYVKLTDSTYSVAAKRTVSVSTDAHSSVDGVMDGQKFVPGDVLTITASADEYYTATLTVGGATQTSPYELTTTDADVTVAVTAVRDTVTVTIPTIPEHASVSVSFVSGGEGHTATTAGDITVDAGTDVTATWTADSGYTITAGASQTLSAVTSAQTLTAPTVEAVSQEATVSNVSFSPSANGKATVTATITGPATTATLTYGGSPYNANVVNGSVTFENVSVGQTSDSYFAPTEYSLTTDAGQTTGQTSGLVDGTSWINENATTHVGGAWTNDVSYVNNKATIKDNRFEATSAAPTAAGGLVVLTMNVNFPTFSDAMVDGDAQGAITLREVNDTPTFSVLTTNESGKVWTDVTGAGSVNTNIDYVITLTFNYAANKYTAAVGGTTLSAAGGVSEFDILRTASSVQNIDFVGEGVLEYLKGDVAAEGAMVEDAQHNKYATVDAAIAAYNADKTIGTLTMLHPGLVPSGWKVVNGIISKIIKGWKLIAY